jgi:signal transduction histidine kinase
MELTSTGRRWAGPPLAWQILGLLVGGLVVAQLVTLVLTLLLPPAPQKRYDLGDVAQALSGERLSSSLQRTLQVDPPEVSGPGWLTSERSRHELAQLLGRADGDVLLYFYTPLPFAGTARTSASATILEDLPRVRPADYLVAQAGPPPRPPPGDRGGGLNPSGPRTLGGGGPDAQGLAAPGGAFPAGPTGFPSQSGKTFPNAIQNATPGNRGSSDRPLGTPAGNGMVLPGGGPGGLRSPGSGTAGDDGQRDSIMLPRMGTRSPAATGLPTAVAPAEIGRTMVVPRSPLSDSGGVLHAPESAPADGLRLGAPPATSVTPATPATAESARVRTSPPPPVATTASKSAEPSPRPRAAGAPTNTGAAPSTARLSATTEPRGLFGLAPAPFVEGDFLAAVSGRDGWAVVQPVAEPFPNSWQRRVLLWFAVSLAVIAPIGWLFARRLVRPIAGFAIAAEQLGRDPTAPVMALEGPAEVGRAAHAFNRMQSRLRSFVDDRTAMIGAISHDLRTPLTRMRFRIEEIDDQLRDGMLHEVEEMEAMITSVLAFIRDASEPGSRERLDLATIVEDVVEDAVFVGNDVKLMLNEPALVEVDAIGMRRLLTNLVENAVKYGEHARVRLFTDRTEAIAEVVDDGPGLPDDELERVFEPFYRAQAAKASGKQGSGLGLAVCRSIARAHGGDVRLFARREAHGLVAQVRLPLAYGTRGMKAA